ncbi:MAG: kinase [Baekduia sp.]|nr:kinase [Baekduia sp.]
MTLDARTIDRIGLVVHPHRRLDRALSSVHAWAAEHDAEIVQVIIDGQERVVAEAGDASSCDLIIALGGDGTTLAALHAAAPYDIPVLGVACGSLGALTATSADRIDESLRRIATGAWQPRILPGVAVSADGGEPWVALNDLVVVRKGAGQVAIEIRIDGELYVRFAGDGIVIASPLGSSAYTMAAGGPILAPGTAGVVLTPLAPHGGVAPPAVVSAQSVVTIAIEPSHAGARVEFDGQMTDAQPRTLEVTWRARHATLVAFDDAESLLAGLRRRRILMDSPRLLARDDRAAATAAETPSADALPASD